MPTYQANVKVKMLPGQTINSAKINEFLYWNSSMEYYAVEKEKIIIRVVL